MRYVKSKDFTGDKAWASLPIASMNGISTKLHWTDQPYKWHVNDGEEVFVVLDGVVDMHYKNAGVEEVVRMTTGDIFFADKGTEHVAKPDGEARILVVETDGSV